MTAMGIFLLIVGVVLLLKPSLVWTLTESWKTEDGTEPSSLYIWSTRFGGVMCICVGVGVIIVSYI
ncbi:DUF6199 family natural product biosynthesis protein [Ferdinandcohnia sp. Marseille-Q9671]